MALRSFYGRGLRGPQRKPQEPKRRWEQSRVVVLLERVEAQLSEIQLSTQTHKVTRTHKATRKRKKSAKAGLKTKRAEPASTRATVPPKRTRLFSAAPFISIGQIVWDTMMQFYAFGSAPTIEIDKGSFLMQISESDLSTPVNRPEPLPDPDDAALCRLFEDQEEQSPTESATPMAPPGLVFNIGDDPANQEVDRRSSLVDTYGDMDWSLDTTSAASDWVNSNPRKDENPLAKDSNTSSSSQGVNLDAEDHQRSLDSLSAMRKIEHKKAAEARQIAYDSPEAVADRARMVAEFTVAIVADDRKDKPPGAPKTPRIKVKGSPAWFDFRKIGKSIIKKKMAETEICMQETAVQTLLETGNWPVSTPTTYFPRTTPLPQVMTVVELDREERLKEDASAERISKCGCFNAGNPYHACTSFCSCRGSCLYPKEFTTSEMHLVKKIFGLLDCDPAPTLRFVEEEFHEMITAMMLEIPKTSFEDWVDLRIGGQVEIHDDGPEVDPEGTLRWLSWRTLETVP